MSRSIPMWLLSAAVALGLTWSSVPASAAIDPTALCHKTVVKQLEKYKKVYLKAHLKCLDKENAGDISGPCPDAIASAKISGANSKITLKIATKCTMQQLSDLGYRSDCAYGTPTGGIAGTCAGLPVTTASEFSECMKCWKGAEFARFVATLYASHAEELCGAALDDSSGVCSDVGCTTPRPDQRDINSGGEYDCQRAISKAGFKHLTKREKTLEKCLLKTAGTVATCIADPIIQAKLATLATKTETIILNKCANRDPVISPPFCCRTGTGQVCSVAATREECTDTLLGTVMEGKVCGIDNNCGNPPGNQKYITWWEHCPDNEPCPGPTLGDINGVIGCVGGTADRIVDGLLCLQFPNADACPPAATPNPTPTP
jgi:hypothetical protein